MTARSTTQLLPADPDGIARAAALLRAGGLVAFGTETVYGLGADAENAEAVAGIFAAKRRPRHNPLICHYADAAAAFADVAATPAARLLAAALWPGPLTLVLPRRPDCRVAPLTGGGLDTLAVRVPAQAAALALLRAVGRPVAAPSANRSGRVSPTTAAHVLEELGGRIDAVLDSGPCPVGVESTVLDLSGERPLLLRPGGVPLEAIEAVIGPLGGRLVGPRGGTTDTSAHGMAVEPAHGSADGAPDAMAAGPAHGSADGTTDATIHGLAAGPARRLADGAPDAAIHGLAAGPAHGSADGAPDAMAPGLTGDALMVPLRSPGMLSSHYAPALPLRLHAHDLQPDEVLLAFGPPLPGARVVFNLSACGDPTEAAARLFAGLRWLDAEAARHGLTRIAVMPVPEIGLGRAINDRLRRAAAPRP